MSGQQNRRHQRRQGAKRFDLFAIADNAPLQHPDWNTLPAQTRQALTDLMARLILSHEENRRRPLPRETRHDV